MNMNQEMNDEMRDAELDALRDSWQVPAPSAGFHQRVLAAYKAEFQHIRAPRRRFSLTLRQAFAGLAAACLLVAGILIGARFHRESTHVAGSGNGSGPTVVGPYQPVHRPSFVVISQGEQP